MLSKIQPVTESGEGGSRLAIVFNGSPLFTGNAGSGESNIRRWIIENDWLEAIVALPDQLFYNTGISTYVWVLTNHKKPRRKGKVQLIDGRGFFVKMRKSLGDKRNKIGDLRDDPGEPDHIGDLTRIHGNFKDGELWDQTDEDPTAPLQERRPRVVSKVFANEEFGYCEVTVERPLRLNFAATPERIGRLENERAFQNLARSKKRPGPAHDTGVAVGLARQKLIRSILRSLGEATCGELIRDREEFLSLLKEQAGAAEIRLSAPERKAVLSALGERDAEAAICRDSRDNPEPDTDLRDTEKVPLLENVGGFIAREVLLYFPDAWVDESKTKIGYEISFNQHFYVYEPLRPLEEIRSELQALEDEISQLLSEATW